MIHDNIEGYRDWSIARNWWQKRTPGLSAMVRVKDEAEWLPAALTSIVGWCDEVLVAVQGEQTDATDRIAVECAQRHPHVWMVRYPFDSVTNGPGHDQQPRGSVYERAYFYNWCLAQTRHRHVMKWDGDMVALDDAGDQIRSALADDYLRFAGWEIVDADRMRLSATQPHTARELRVFPAREGVHYVTGPCCERLQAPAGAHRIREPLYLHFKWAKAWTSATKAWPSDWSERPHFRRIAARADAGDTYTGPMPEVLRA